MVLCYVCYVYGVCQGSVIVNVDLCMYSCLHVDLYVFRQGCSFFGKQMLQKQFIQPMEQPQVVISGMAYTRHTLGFLMGLIAIQGQWMVLI